MCIVLVNWTNIYHNDIIDGRVPIFTHPYQAGYWIPSDIVDSFVEAAMAETNVKQTTVYKYDRTYKN